MYSTVQTNNRLVVVAAAALFWAIPGPAALPQEPAEPQYAAVDPVLYERLAESGDGTVYAIILLQPVPVQPRGQLAGQQAQVDVIQDRVLARLAVDEFEVVHRYENFAAMIGRVNAAGLAKLAADPDVIRIGPNEAGRGQLDDSVPFIGADAVQRTGYTGEGVTVAVLDSGIDTDHADLSDDIAAGAYHYLHHDLNGDGAPDCNNPAAAYQGAGAEDGHGHGTNVSGIITSKGVQAPVGVAPDTDILAVKVLDNTNSGCVSDWAAGVDYVVSHADDYDSLCAINMSLGTDTNYTSCPCDDVSTSTQLLQAAIWAARSAGIVTFAASGNSCYCDRMKAPACVSSAEAVAAVYDQDLGSQSYWPPSYTCCTDATTTGDKIACFSNRLDDCNQYAAPGVKIVGPKVGGGGDWWFTGTSQAAPHCTAVLALMVQKTECLDALWGFMLPAFMTFTGVPTGDPCDSTPNPIRVDARAAVNFLGQVGVGGQGTDAGDEFGHSVAIDRNWLVAGAPDADGAVAGAGKAFVFRRTSVHGWSDQVELAASDPGAGDDFGDAVSISGDLVLVGAPGNDDPSNSGSAYVFRRDGSSWVQEAKLTASDASTNDDFGDAVSISGDRLVVGVPRDSDQAHWAGSAYVFRRQATSWTQEAKLTASDAAADDDFGTSVSISGDLIAVGAPWNDDPDASGSVYVFRREGTSWVEEEKLTASDAAAGDGLGQVVAIDGDRLVAGAKYDDDTGSAYVFRREGTSWVQEDKLVGADVELGDDFACSVAINGDQILIGAQLDDDACPDNPLCDSGAAYLFRRAGTSWDELTKLTIPTAEGLDLFGWSVGLSGGRTVSGATGDNSWTGSAFTHVIGADCNTNGLPDQCDITSGGSLDADTNGIPDECETCAATAVRSCRNHGAAGTLCLNMGISGGVEPRLGGISKLEVDLDHSPRPDDGVTVDCSSPWSGTADAHLYGRTVMVTFAPSLPDRAYCTVTLGCGAEVCVRGLSGDIDRNGLVTPGDASIIKPKFGQTPTEATAQFDYDVSGLVTPGDFSQLKPRFGNSAPACP